jgi:hypothetical protein
MAYARLKKSVNISEFLKSPIYQRETHRALDTPSGLPYSTSVTVKVNAFLRAFPTNLGLIYKCANVYFGSQPPNQKYNPFKKPLTIFACSTFPALFGYCLCREQGIAFVESLYQLISLQIKLAAVSRHPRSAHCHLSRRSFGSFSICRASKSISSAACRRRCLRW